MRHTVVLVPADAVWIAALVPTMPGCVSQGRNRAEALANIREAMAGWLEIESEYGRAPLPETSGLVLDAVASALRTCDEMRNAGELPVEHSYDLELVGVIPLALPVAP